MYVDSQTLFSNAQAITAVGNTDSTNFIDLSAVRDLGPGNDLWLFCDVTQTILSGGSATLALELLTDTSPTFANGYPPIYTSPVEPVASLLAGFTFGRVVVPVGTLRYLKVTYVVGTAALTAGTVTSGLVKSLQLDEYYPSGYSAAAI